MSKWCEKCKREPYIGCDDSCPVFGLNFEELAEKYLIDKTNKEINPMQFVGEFARGLVIHEKL